MMRLGRLDARGIAVAEMIRSASAPGGPGERRVSEPLIRSGKGVRRERLSQARDRHQRPRVELPLTAGQLSRGGPAVRTEVEEVRG